MGVVRQGLALALLAAGLAIVPVVSGPAPVASAAPDDLLRQLRGAADGRVAVSPEPATGRVGFVRSSEPGHDLLPGVAGDSGPAAVAKSVGYLKRFGAVFGAAPGQLRQSGVQAYRHGWVVRFEQTYRGLPVFGGELKANLDDRGRLTAVSGRAAPDLSLDVTPRLSESEARERAVATVRADPPSTGNGRAGDVPGLTASDAELMVYRLGSTRGEPGEAVLAWVVDVTDGGAVRERVSLDADTGKPVNRYSLLHDALDRRLYEGSIEADGSTRGRLVWKEGQPLPGKLTTSQANLVRSAGDTYWFFRNAWNRDSYDGQGAEMRTLTVDPDPATCPNAFWDGFWTVHCPGVGSDDVAAHEWAHAYTEHTSGLVYQWQPGALNEAYSDIWGETIDLLNAREDADEGDLEARRPDGACSTHTRTAIEVTITAPDDVAGPCADAAPADFGPRIDRTGVTADVVVATDRDEDGGGSGNTRYDGCSAFDNPGSVSGSWAYVDRGGCGFQRKVDNAETAGATGLVVGNNVSDVDPFSMSAASDLYGVMVTRADGARFKRAGTATVTAREANPDGSTDSFRWLVGEKADAFGGAIRDMWSPTCYGHPGKVSDAEYWCREGDAGGVHSNSGVVNHAFALLADGGTYHGVDVAGLGLDRAAHLFWQAQAAHLTSTSGFADLADALEAACTELTGQPLSSLSTQPDPAGGPPVTIRPTDCEQVHNVTEAVELRLDPATQCDFRPLLAKNPPRPCGKGSRTVRVWREGFEDGLTGWKRRQHVVFPEGRGFRWRPTDEAPGHRSRAAYAPDPQVGSCAGDADDVSSRDRLVSPVVRMGRRVRAPRLVFDHYVATEAGWDGGNVRVRVNRGRWQLVPKRAYRFNAPRHLLESENAGNTNPLAGQRAWTGTDGGEVVGSWGQTQVNLARLGVGRRDRVRIRFDFGRDGCGGLDGWYVDNVRVFKCLRRARRGDAEA